VDALPSDAELQRLAESLGDASKVVQRRAAEALVRLAGRGCEIRTLLARMLAEAPPRGRWGAVFALSLLDAVPEEALPVLTAALAAADGDVRWAACDILVRRTAAWSEGAARALQDLAVNGDLRQRRMALYALRDLDRRGGDSESAARLAVVESDSDLRLAGMAALVRLADDRPAAARDIAALLTDADLRVRRAAAGTLGMLGCKDPAVCAALTGAATDADASTARAARRALQRLEE
jgi:HEAT repeat protein